VVIINFIRRHPVWSTVIILIFLYIIFLTKPQPIMQRQPIPAKAPPSPGLLKERQEADYKINQRQEEQKSLSSYVGVWKTEKEMYRPGQEWRKSSMPSAWQILPDGKVVILMPYPRPDISITGTWKVLDDGRLQISEEGMNGKPIRPPSISVFTLENGKLIKPARAYVNEKEKAQIGFILKKVERKEADRIIRQRQEEQKRVTTATQKGDAEEKGRIRKEFAKSLEEVFLDKLLMDTKVTVEGKAGEVLRIRGALMGRAMAYQLFNKAGLGETGRQMGFKKVIFENSIDHSWWKYTLE